jgi:hypothetical protein
MVTNKWLFALTLWPTLLSANTYTTNFPLTENPIFEHGNWINGGTTGLDWTDIQTVTWHAFGTQPGNVSGNSVYADSTAVLAGNWGPDQTAQASIFVNNASNDPSVFEEVELRLRTIIAAHWITGYEINCSTNPSNFYLQIVRWDGPLGNFTQLNGASMNAKNGDVLTATINGNTITAYLNGVQALQAIDNTYANGSPGIGWFLQGATGLNAEYGFLNFSATDGAPAPIPTPIPTQTPTPDPSVTPVPTPTPIHHHHHWWTGS